VCVLHNGIAVFPWLAWNLLTLADANVRNKTALIVLLEELPDLLLSSIDLLWKNRRDPN
jgi:hypothetical protein